MKPLLVILLLLGCYAGFAQPVKKNVKKKPGTAKKKAVRTPIEDRILPSVDGTFLLDLAPGDVLVYEVDANGNTYDFVVTLKYYEPTKKGVSFNWTMTSPVNKSGTVNISPKGMDSRAYVNYFKGGVLNLANAATVFLTHPNFSDMPNKKTEMTLDGTKETFYRPAADEAPFTITCHDKLYVIGGFTINNAEDGTGDKSMVIQNTSAMPLILSMDLGFSIRLKEVK